MYPEPRYHTFETRLVKLQEGFAFMRLSKDPNGVFYIISKSPINCIVYNTNEINKLIHELEEAATKPVIDLKDIHE